MVWRIERSDIHTEQVERFTQAVRNGTKTALSGPPGRGKTEILLDVARELGDEALLVRVPQGLDQAESVVIQAAARLGKDVLQEVDNALRDNVTIDLALNTLAQHLNGRSLVVDDIDWLALHPGDFDLHGIVKERTSTLEAWLSERAYLCSRSLREGRIDVESHELKPSTDPPLRLLNGISHDVAPLWDSVGQDATRFRLALTLAQIEGRPPEKSTGPQEPLLATLWEALPSAHRSVLVLLAIHGRPLPDEVLGAVSCAPSAQTIAEVRSLAAIGSDARSLWVDGSLLAFSRDALSEDQKTAAHLTLAAAFAGGLHGNEPNAWSAAESLLEAHRHYAAGRESQRALRFARYSVALLLDLARTESLRGECAAAAAIYADVLKLPEPPIDKRTQAYATHYLHYNRYKSKPLLIEPLSETEDGYRRSVDGWPENALFWSRLALMQFLQGDRGRALDTLKDARRKVPDHGARSHTGKDWHLRCRTVDHLLHFDPPQIVEALLVWSDHTANGFREQAVERALSAVLSIGFRTVWLEAPGVSTVYLHREITVEIRQLGKAFACTLVELHISARANDRLAAFTEAITKLRAEADRFRQTLTHMLDSDARAQKQRLLSHVDIVASRLMGEVPASTWVLGKVVSGEGTAMRLQEVGSGAGIFDLDPSVTPPLLPEIQPRLARVRAGKAGEPIGPVLELGEPLGRDPDRLWDEWRRRLGEAKSQRG